MLLMKGHSLLTNKRPLDPNLDKPELRIERGFCGLSVLKERIRKILRILILLSYLQNI